MRPDPPRRRRASGRLLTLALLAVLGLGSACGDAHSDRDAAGDAGSSGATAADGTALASADAGSLSLAQGWVIASDAGMSGMDMSSGDTGDMSGDMSGMDMSGAMSAAYAVIHNDGDRPDALVSVSTSVATEADLHHTRVSADGSSGTMTAAPRLVVPAHGEETLQPGGDHVMLRGLSGALTPGSTVEMTWTFASGTTVRTSFPVLSPEDRPQP